MRALLPAVIMAMATWLAALSAQTASAEESEAEAETTAVAPPSATVTPEETEEPPRPGYEARNHWDNGLDVKVTDLFDKEASDIGSPSLMLAAQWSYKFSTYTYMGLAVGGLPQGVEHKEADVETSYSLYYGGLYLAQALYESRPFRLVLTVTGGRGLLYSRTKVSGQDSEADARKFDLVEPGLFATVYEYKGVELGLSVSSRQIKLEEQANVTAEDEDVSSLAYGLTFRTQRY